MCFRFGVLMRISAGLIWITALTMPGGARPPVPNDDFDVMLIPAGAGVNPADDPTPPGRVWQVLPVLNRPLPRHEAGPDRITITLRPGEAVQFVSHTIPVTNDSVYWTCRMAVEGQKPGPAALAVYDATNPEHLAVSILSQPGGGPEARDTSLEFHRPGLKAVQCLVQLQGPESGESLVTLDRLRLLEGYSDQDHALGASRLAATGGAEGIKEQPVVHTPPSTLGGYCRPSGEVLAARWPKPVTPVICLGTESSEDIIQVKLPLPPEVDRRMIPSFPARIFALARVRRIRGMDGVLSIALFSQDTQSGGYSEYPVASLPEGAWSRIAIPVLLAEAEMRDLMLILQVRGGPAEIELDDASLHARRDTPHFWKTDRISRPGDGMGR